jgi:putative FmdB family regulatory protein
MPIYEYECESCGHRLEAIQKMNDPALADCPACGESKLKKRVTAAGFQLKGSGWYATDFKGNSARKDKVESDPVAPKKAHGCGGGSCGCAS